MAAAVADFRPSDTVDHKIKKSGGAPAPIELQENPDILAELVAPADPAPCSSASPPRPATSGASVLDHGRAKLARKGCDLLVVNAVGPGTGVRPGDNAGVILGRRRHRDVVELRPEGGAGRRAVGRRRRPGSTG